MAEGGTLALCGPMIIRIDPKADALVILAGPTLRFAVWLRCGCPFEAGMHSTHPVAG
jgi:hypothetical protein